MRTPTQHQDDAFDFISRAFNEGPADEYLAAAQVQATLAVASAISGSRADPSEY